MAFIFGDRVQETTTTTGTGTVTMLGAASQMQSFSLGVGANNSTSYCILDGNGSAWEVGYGTVGAGGTTLTRDTILQSSNSNAAITLTSNTHTVFCTNPAAFISRRLFSTTSSVGNGADTSEDTLQTYTMPANTLNTNGQTVRVTAGGVLVSSTNSKEIRVYFGGTAVAVAIYSIAGQTSWRTQYEVVRTGAATQVATGYHYSNTLVGGGDHATPSETLSGTVVIKVTGQNNTIGTANTMTCDFMLVEFIA